MRVRMLERRDREAVAGILRSDHTFDEGEVAVALELVDGAIAQPDGDYQALVLEDDGLGGNLLGYICYGRTPMTVSTWDLYWVATHQEARGRGVGRRLLGAMEAELVARRAGVVRLETSQSEAYGAARAFYDRTGWAEVGRIPDFYKPGDDLLIFAKRLDAVTAQVA